MRKLIIFVLLLMVAFAIMYMRPVLAYGQDHPVPRNFHEYSGAMKGTVPGFVKKPTYFSSKMAKEQLLYLYHEKNVRLIISLDHCENVKKVLKRIAKKDQSFDMQHICRKIVRGKKYYERNITLFEEVADAIGNVKFYIHCRYGAHRAVTALTGGWIAKQKLTFEEAFINAGGKKRNFRYKTSKELIGHAKRYAKELMELEVKYDFKD